MPEDCPNTFLHVDINAYFATLLQQENPFLRGKPIGIIKEHRRSCVIAASKEAKKLGVKTGSSVFDAKKLAPNILFIPAAFPLYLHATKTLQKVFASVCPDVEIFSLDEAFLNITSCNSIYPDPAKLGKEIQNRIKKALGEWVTCNVGIGTTRFLAKLASETAPKGSVIELTSQNRNSIFATAKFEEVCGIGHRLEKKLFAIGVTNLLLLEMCPDEELIRQVGPFWAKELRAMTSDKETHQLSRIDANDQMKSVGRSITGYSPCDSEHEIKRILLNLIEESTWKARRMGLAGRQVWVGLWSGVRQSGNWKAAHGRVSSSTTQFWCDHRTLRSPISTAQEMFQIVCELYEQCHRDFPVIKFGVRLGLLESEEPNKLLLFERDRKKLAAVQAADAVNQRYGLFTVRSGLLLNVPIIRPEVTGFLGDKTYQLGKTV
jgi:DNA polymerase-4